ncbi:methyltransferase domain-containing protein [Planotetraspora sp. A-T 1434]|uniref:methyltransferase domain-containing protein n=1 Tax=Planotetraspora sp. A-T 1434 TaxID=2979219 RepID=UPI0021C18A49|nr:methyltransferase domain-containing protein [Planotetraspora sp. A-T 1434]MCT9933183.1 methyltransferase domain-containing protein [Planotetraspora sp. A-T 1434]
MNTAQRIDALCEVLAANQELTDGVWRAALHAVPRHLFVPDRAWAAADDGPGYAIDRELRPEAWMDAAYADHPIITQLDDGATDVTTGDGHYTSSLSAPGVVVEFLEILDPYDGDRVLEIGTGTGWTAALLAHRLGDGNVTSVEIDKEVHAAAADNLATAGLSPRLILGDGAEGRPDGAPYDRVHVTCGVSRVPYAWVEQTRPGGIIVLPWMPEFEGGHKVALTVGRDGRAIGRFAYRGAAYMMLRAQRPPGWEYAGDYRKSTATLDPRRVLRAGTGLDVAVAGMLPGVSAVTDHSDGFEVWLSDGESGAWVSGDEVNQYGPRSLWDELEEVFFTWVGWGNPARDRFGLTVAPDGQRVWLDSPDNPLSPVRPTAVRPPLFQ